MPGKIFAHGKKPIAREAFIVIGKSPAMEHVKLKLEKKQVDLFFIIKYLSNKLFVKYLLKKEHWETAVKSDVFNEQFGTRGGKRKHREV